MAYSFGVVVNLWVHTNLNVSLGPLDALIITPAFHRLHHGRDYGQMTNFGFLLTVWDRMFGTYVDPKTLGDAYPLGLAAKENIPRMIAGV